eukprot:977472-Pelagomonas_calceolata.AAC.1
MSSCSCPQYSSGARTVIVKILIDASISHLHSLSTPSLFFPLPPADTRVDPLQQHIFSSCINNPWRSKCGHGMMRGFCDA